MTRVETGERHDTNCWGVLLADDAICSCDPSSDTQGVPMPRLTEMRMWQATTDNGAAWLALPRSLTAADVADVAEWFGLILRTLNREVAGSRDATVSPAAGRESVVKDGCEAQPAPENKA